jgi:hypothetical protein
MNAFQGKVKLPGASFNGTGGSQYRNSRDTVPLGFHRSREYSLVFALGQHDMRRPGTGALNKFTED